MSASKYRLMSLVYIFLLLALALGLASPAGNVLAGLPSGGMANPLLQGAGPQPFDCSRIEEWGIDKMTNMRAYQILAECGRVKPAGAVVPRPGAVTQPIADALISPLYGGHD